MLFQILTSTKVNRFFGHHLHQAADHQHSATLCVPNLSLFVANAYLWMSSMYRVLNQRLVQQPLPEAQSVQFRQGLYILGHVQPQDLLLFPHLHLRRHTIAPQLVLAVFQG